MTDEEFVKSVYPKATLESHFLFGIWFLAVHCYQEGYIRNDGFNPDLPPVNNEQAWKQAADYLKEKMIHKLES